jgi:hypothetical protein
MGADAQGCSSGGIMSERASSKPTLREKSVEEFKAFAALSIYLYICLGALVLYKSAILQEAGISFTIWGIAAIKAMLLAKFMLLGRMLHVGKRYRDKPLIWPAAYHALMSLVVLLILTTVEELVVGFIHDRTLGDSLSHVVGPTVFQGLAVCLVMFLVLVPYSAFTCLGDVLGERELFRLFFVDRAVDGAVRARLADRMPPAQTSG